VPTWGEILVELQGTAAMNNGVVDFDSVRRGYLRQLHAETGRDVILYATDWVGGTQAGSVTAITLEDMQALMEVVRGMHNTGLDIVLHSPGGSAEAVASVVRYLRSRYDDIRVFIPLAAMSAATMWALACNRIVMGAHSQLGPIDPQLVTAQGQQPARAVIEQFERAKRECSANPSLLGAWAPILQGYGPALIQQCEDQEALAKRLVGEWLEAYMFNGDPDAGTKAAAAADYFADYGLHQSHSLAIDRDMARAQGLVVEDLDANPRLQDAVLSVHHAAMHTLSGTATAKIVENHLGRAYVKVQQAAIMQIPVQPQPSPPAAPPAAP
jgi:hypothetical protein